MATLYQPKFNIFINNFNVTTSISPYLISIDLEDVFDANFTVSKLELTIHAKYLRSSNWQYKDQIKVELWWEPYPLFKYISGVFYVDYMEDVKSQGGLQTYIVSALEADPTLGFTYGSKQIVLTNKTTKQAVLDFKNLFGLTLSENMIPNVYLGTIKDFATATDFSTVTATFNSYAEMLIHICNTYGYFGNLSGKNLQIFSVESSFTDSSRFFVRSLKNIFSFNSKQVYNSLKQSYNSVGYNRILNSLQYALLRPPQYTNLNNKTENLEITDTYYNMESAQERLYGAMYRDFYTGFEVTINTPALPEFEAGNIFLLDSSYGVHEGYHRCTRVRHKVDGNGWVAELTGFPLKIISATVATFNVGYTGSFYNPVDPVILSISQSIRGTAPTLTATQLDSFAKYYNPNYTLNLGAAFISEGVKSANLIRPDIAFCLALVVTKNFTDADLVVKKNPGAIAGSGVPFATFTDWTTGGIRAEIQHLFAYATSTGSPADTIVDPRYGFVGRGTATTIDALINKWNSDLDFSSNLKDKLLNFYIFLNPKKIIQFSN